MICKVVGFVDLRVRLLKFSRERIDCELRLTAQQRFGDLSARVSFWNRMTEITLNNESPVEMVAAAAAAAAG